jgi:Flp pilus assembly protein TadG
VNVYFRFFDFSCLRAEGASFVQADDGSAIIEFVLLAIPLMIPLIIYLGMVHQSSTINSDLHNLARQSARAFITSSDESFEPSRIQNLLSIFEQRILQPDGIREAPTIAVECSATPCLTPDSRVKVTATLTLTRNRWIGILRFISAQSEQFSASDIQIVDAWR